MPARPQRSNEEQMPDDDTPAPASPQDTAEKPPDSEEAGEIRLRKFVIPV
ncbi:MAG: hypothetical protein GY696_38930 [Gammaproteobacteria bacterium]|nr:hypothetical protein [Gammaproteobacteria bacterium]